MYVSPATQYSVNFNLLSSITLFTSTLFYCAFRRGHGCQTTLFGLLEDWREALDKNQHVAAVLMDLSKHDILLDKLSAYGISSHSLYFEPFN
jgi:hypothetical protein